MSKREKWVEFENLECVGWRYLGLVWLSGYVVDWLSGLLKDWALVDSLGFRLAGRLRCVRDETKCD